MGLDLVRKISNGVKGLNVLVSDMLTFTRDLQLVKHDEELNEIVMEALELAAPGLLEHDVRVRVHGSVEGKRVHVDRRLLGRVFLNLGLNGGEGIGEGGVKEGGGGGWVFFGGGGWGGCILGERAGGNGGRGG